MDEWTATARNRLQNLPLRKRVSIFAAIGVGLLVVLISVSAYVTVRMSLLHQVDSNLLARAHAASGGPLTNVRVLREIPAEALGAGDLKIALVNALGEAVSSPDRGAPPYGVPEIEVAGGFAPDSIRTTRDPATGKEYRVVAVPVQDGQALVMAQWTGDSNRILGALGFVLFLVGGIGVGLAAWGGWGISRTALQPVRRLTAAAEHVARTEDLRPIPVQGNDELARLAHSFNAMLGALGEARNRQRRLVADAGHELRTPLTSLRTNLDLLAQSEGTNGLPPEERVALLRDVRAQVLELTTLVGDLVELSREDPAASARGAVNLADVTRRSIERVRLRAPSVAFKVDLAPWNTIGDVQLLERAITNLLDNAAKWSPPGGVVTVDLRGGLLTVTDQGPGINEADLPHVFERFYRSTEARMMPGSGLGLAIVKQAADRHGGMVQAGRAPSGGALMSLRIPGTPGPIHPR
ncbi:sensor histidine kinase [Tenggerimyces flavus]|uniref:histidine kinase n=1 Tax=Tenggerimyces flavus TaxID=1708749 RepID=A0ABV7YF18_9ACTN|nr:HAMP domain-containing sensor histidine kinase [Tenggerimyces flavus]MBM7787186.1 two-component system sensor histidine kinase MprB [Tenggerimyces flavus]